MVQEITPFIGIEEPPCRPDAPTWKERLKGLSLEQYRGQWAKYGPTTSRHMKSKVQGTANAMVLDGVAEVIQVDDYIYVRVIDADQKLRANGEATQSSSGNAQTISKARGR